MPNEQCKGVDYHLAGMFLKHHIDYLIELVKEDLMPIELGDPYD